MNKDYVQGFVNKCAAAGFDAEKLLKFAQGAPAGGPLNLQAPMRNIPSWNIGGTIGRSLFNMTHKKPLPALPNPASVAAAGPKPAPAVAKAAPAPGSFEAGGQKAMMSELLR